MSRLTPFVVSLALSAVATTAMAQTRPAPGPAPIPTPASKLQPAPGPAAKPAVTPATVPAAPAVATSVPAPEAAPAPSLTPAVPTDFVIGPEDLLQVTVWKNDTLSRQVPVRPDGKISLPLLHDVQAAGLTAMQLRDKISVALAEFMPNPEVSVIVTEVRSFRVSVLGEVQRPGILQLRSETSILEALAMAGGFRDFASPSKITVFRKDTYGSTHKLRFNYNRALRGEDDNFALKTGDVVVVP